jgi:hypothetical protein
MGVAVDSEDNLYVADTGNHRIQKFAQKLPSSGTGVTLTSFPTVWGSMGSGDERFVFPRGVAVASIPNICRVDIAWYNGNTRVYHFAIATSTDGITFTNIFSGDSSGNTINSEKYTIPSTNARYLKVTVNGNTQNNYASITELDTFGSSPITGSCAVNFPISDVTASGNDGNLPQNVLDGSLATRWASSGVGQFLIAHLDSRGDVFVADTNNNRIQQFIDDTMPPTVTITNPNNGATLKTTPPHLICMTCPTLNVPGPVPSPIGPSENIEIAVTASDNVKVAQVQFFAN